METGGLDPDALLQSIQRREERSQQGKLKIFLGMVAGVGKTYAMLQAAHQKLAEGTDIIIGWVDTHGRAETNLLVAGLELIPRRRISYRDVLLEEMDLDAILARKPQVVLVDELAHTNVPGSRHAKRYQDVLELLDAGIHVYTTLNIQHIESRADTVQQITGVRVHERVPDTILDLADEVSLIDIGPEDLLERLKEGKVYLGEGANRAAENFFKSGNLTALREMALLLTAERVEQDLRDYMSQHRVLGPWRSRERLMVAVSASPMSEELIRWTRGRASHLSAPWLAVYVDTGHPLTDNDQQRLTKNLEFARELGAEVITTQGKSLLDTIMHIASQNYITQIIVGKPQESWFRDIFNGRLWAFYAFLRRSGPIDISVIDSSRGQTSSSPRPWIVSRSGEIRDYLIALLAIFLTTVINWFLAPRIGYWSVALLFMSVVIFLPLVLKRGAVLLTAALSALIWNYFFIPPRFTFHIEAFEDFLMCLMYFVVSLTVVELTSRLKRQEQAGRQRENRIHILYHFSREMASAVNLKEIEAITARHVQNFCQAETQVMVIKTDMTLSEWAARYPDLPPKEIEVAQWVFQHQRPAGRLTETLPAAQGYYLPLRGHRTIQGVLRILVSPDKTLSFDQKQLLETLADQVGGAIERKQLQETAAHALLHEESERLYSALLNSVSHELKTPITTIQGAINHLQPNGNDRNPLEQTLLNDIETASKRLNRLVSNLLDMSRLQSGYLQPRMDWCDMGDIVRSALHNLSRELQDYPVTLDFPAEIPPIRLDFGLTEQVVTNLLHNVTVHNPPGTVIQIQIETDDKYMYVHVADRGKGLDEATIPYLFNKFYRSPTAKTGGSGLGLSICQGFVVSQGGKIEAENREEGGARFSLTFVRHPLPELPEEEMA